MQNSEGGDSHALAESVGESVGDSVGESVGDPVESEGVQVGLGVLVARSRCVQWWK